VLSTDQKGSIAEIMIAAAAIKLGIDVYKPVNDGTRCDLISILPVGSRGFNASGPLDTATF
jgi:hypothetical protein